MTDPPRAPLGAQISSDFRTRALEFQRALDDSLATRVEPMPWGEAIFRDDLPRAVDLNLLRVGAVESDVDAYSLMSWADALQAGLPHRAVRVLDPAIAERVAPGFSAGGWVLRRTAIMVQRRMRNRPVDVSSVRELGIDEVRGARSQAIMQEHRDHEVGGEVLAAGELEADGVPPRVFGAAIGPDVTAYCMLRARGDVAKITEAESLARAGGRGLGNAVIAQAVLAARRGGASLVFVEAADEDWAKWTYRRMGFDETGALHLFVRPWGD